MEVKKTVPSNTITRDIKYLAEPTGIIYETVVIHNKSCLFYTTAAADE